MRLLLVTKYASHFGMQTTVAKRGQYPMIVSAKVF